MDGVQNYSCRNDDARRRKLVTANRHYRSYVSHATLTFPPAHPPKSVCRRESTSTSCHRLYLYQRLKDNSEKEGTPRTGLYQPVNLWTPSFPPNLSVDRRCISRRSPPTVRRGSYRATVDPRSHSVSLFRTWMGGRPSWSTLRKRTLWCARRTGLVFVEWIAFAGALRVLPKVLLTVPGKVIFFERLCIPSFRFCPVDPPRSIG